MSEDSAPDPAGPDETQRALRIAWLYFVEGWTQGEIARALSTSRRRINLMIGAARQSGLVGFSINSRLAPCVALERALISGFGLKMAIVVPVPPDAALLRARIGAAAAGHLAQLIAAGRVRSIAVSWGATLRELVRLLPPMQRPDLYVTSAQGGLARGADINSFEIAAAMARQLGAECGYLAAPLYAGSTGSRRAIMEQEVFRAAFRRVAASDILVMGVGDLAEGSHLVRHALPADVGRDALLAAGGCGDILGHVIDARGAPVAHELNRRAITLPLDELRRIPVVLAVAAGPGKVAPLAGVLRAGWANTLVTDEATARAVLGLAQVPGPVPEGGAPEGSAPPDRAAPFARYPGP